MLKGDVMKKLILSLLLVVLVPCLAHAQLPSFVEGLQNPMVVAGGTYLTTDPGLGSSRVRFLLTANVAGIKPVETWPLYIGGAGIDIRTLDPVLGSVTGVGISIPILTYAIKDGQFVVQAGWSHDLQGTPASGGIYAGIGFSLTSPAKLAYKRAVKKAKAAGQPPPPCK